MMDKTLTSNEKKILLIKKLKSRKKEKLTRVSESKLKQTHHQQRVWIHQKQLENTAYNMPVGFYFGKKICLQRFKHALNETYQLHSALRTKFSQDGDRFFQHISQSTLWIEDTDLSNLSPSELRSTQKKLFDQLFLHQFNLLEGPLFYVKICREKDRNLILFNMHHIIADAVSVRQILIDTLSFYEGTFKSATSIERAQYIDYTFSLEKQKKTEAYACSIKYWQNQSRSFKALSSPFASQKVSNNLKSLNHQLWLKQSQTQEILRFCQINRLSVFNFHLTLFCILLSRFSLQNTFTFGVVVSNRPSLDFENVVGNFINIIFANADIDESDNFVNLARKIGDQFLFSMEHQSIPLETIRDFANCNDILNALFVMRNFSVPQNFIDSYSIEHIPLTNPKSILNFVLSCTDTSKGSFLELSHRVYVVTPDQARKFLKSYVALMDDILMSGRQRIGALMRKIPPVKIVFFSEMREMSEFTQLFKKSLEIFKIPSEFINTSQHIQSPDPLYRMLAVRVVRHNLADLSSLIQFIDNRVKEEPFVSTWVFEISLLPSSSEHRINNKEITKTIEKKLSNYSIALILKPNIQLSTQKCVKIVMEALFSIFRENSFDTQSNIIVVRSSVKNDLDDFLHSHVLSRQRFAPLFSSYLSRDLTIKPISSPGLLKPRNNIDQLILKIWTRMFGMDASNSNTSFLSLGGHSLKATQLLAELEKQFSTRISLKDLYENPTVHLLSDCVQKRMEQENNVSDVTFIGQLQDYPTSSIQQRIWFLSELNSQEPVYNIARAFWLYGDFDKNVFVHCIEDLIKRHEILRTSFESNNGQLRQVIHPFSKLNFKIDTITVSNEIEVLNKADQVANQLIDIKAAFPFFRVQHYVMKTDSKCLLLFVVHHIVFDAWSFDLFLGELKQLYESYIRHQPVTLDHNYIRYVDHASFQSKKCYKTELQYWYDLFENYVYHPIISDELISSTTGRAQFSFNLPPEVDITKIEYQLKQMKITPSTFYLTLFMIMLSKYYYEPDIVIGQTFAGRNHKDFQSVMGCFMNILLVRLKIKSSSFYSLFQEVHSQTMTLFENQNMPYEIVKKEVLNRNPDTSKFKLETVFNFINEENHTVDLYELQSEEVPIHIKAKAIFDLELSVFASQESHRFIVTFDAGKFHDSTVHEMKDLFNGLIVNATINPTSSVQQPFLRSYQKKCTKKAYFNPNDIRLPMEQFHAVVDRYPNRQAIVSENVSMTYQSLSKKVRKVSSFLLSRYKSQLRIGLWMSFSEEMVISMLGVLEAGHIYVPIDDSWPKKRKQYILDDANIDVVLVSEHLMDDQFPSKILNEVFALTQVLKNEIICYPAQVAFNTQAYILYTSGSSGQPKGVVQTHGNLSIHAQNYRTSLNIKQKDNMLQIAPFGTDAAVMDLYGALLSGATLKLLDIKKKGLCSLSTFLDKEKITIYHSTPTIFRNLFSIKTKPNLCIRAVVLGGEKVHSKDLMLFRTLFSPSTVLINGLGPTECTIAMQKRISNNDDATLITVGTPVKGLHAELISKDDHGNQKVGELVLFGDQIAEGYWNTPQVTKQSFGCAENQIRYYKTGDLLRLLPSGEYQYLGRIDHQCKINGYRVEINELEYVMRQCPGVQDSCVILKGSPDQFYLVAYWTKISESNNNDFLSEFLKSHLPSYMIPKHLISLAELPLTVSGKVDRAKLSTLTIEPKTKQKHTMNELEKSLSIELSNIFGVSSIDIEKNFFDLGGSSLGLLRFQVILMEKYSIDVSILELYRYTSVRMLANFIQSKNNSMNSVSTTTDILTRRQSYSKFRSRDKKGSKHEEQ